MFGWAVVDPDGRFGDPTPTPARPLATWRFELVPEASGTRLQQSVRLGPGRSGISLAIDRDPAREEAIVAFRMGELRNNMEAMVRGVMALAERRPTAPTGPVT